MKKLLAWLAEAGMNALAVAIIVASCVVIGFVLRIVIRRVVHRIVDSAKNKASVDDTQALERSPSPTCDSCSARARWGRSCRTSST